MIDIVGCIIGLATGAVQFMLLSRFSRGITAGGISQEAILCGIAQFFLPFIVLVGCVFLLRDDLLPAGISIVVSLFGCTAISLIRSRINRDKQTGGVIEQSGGESDEEGDT